MKTKLNISYKVDYWDVKIYKYDEKTDNCYLAESLAAKDYNEAYKLMRYYSKKKDVDYVILKAIPQDSSNAQREFWEWGKFDPHQSGEC